MKDGVKRREKAIKTNKKQPKGDQWRSKTGENNPKAISSDKKPVETTKGRKSEEKSRHDGYVYRTLRFLKHIPRQRVPL